MDLALDHLLLPPKEPNVPQRVGAYERHLCGKGTKIGREEKDQEKKKHAYASGSAVLHGIAKRTAPLCQHRKVLPLSTAVAETLFSIVLGAVFFLSCFTPPRDGLQEARYVSSRNRCAINRPTHLPPRFRLKVGHCRRTVREESTKFAVYRRAGHASEKGRALPRHRLLVLGLRVHRFVGAIFSVGQGTRDDVWGDTTGFGLSVRWDVAPKRSAAVPRETL